VLVVDAVNSLAKREPATINGIAREIGIDQSGASRLVKEAAAAGYLTLKASGADARIREVVLTAAGHKLLLHAHGWQEEVFKYLTEEWTDQERIQLHRAMLRMLDRSHTLGS
jgi:DNA-binding MarR family transcriptional regulator